VGQTLRQLIDDQHAADQVVVPPDVDELLQAIEAQASTVDITQPFAADAAQAIGFPGIASVGLKTGSTVTARLLVQGPAGKPTGFTVDLRLQDGLIIPDAGVRAGQPNSAGSGAALVQWLDPAADPTVKLNGQLVARISGSAASAAACRLLPANLDENSVITLTLDPPHLLFGDSGFGVSLPGGIVIDDSETAVPPPAAAGTSPSPPASVDPKWRGIAIRAAQLHLPRGAPLLGGRLIPVDFELGRPAGLDARTQVQVAAASGLPALTADVQWHDPSASTFAACAPTSVDVTVELPRPRPVPIPSSSPVSFGGGDPIRLRGRFARDLRVSPSTVSLSIGVEADGDAGLISVEATPGQTGAVVFVTAAALATALVADSPAGAVPSGDSSAGGLEALIAAAVGLGSFFTQEGTVVVHGATLAVGVGASSQLAFEIDYSAEVLVKPLELGVLTIQMSDRHKLRTRFRQVRLGVDLTAGDLLSRVHLSFDHATAEVEDPGAWEIAGLGSLFDVLGTRSGHGSTWFEIDLRFALELGPIQVSGATIRATFDGGAPALELRGLDASLTLPGLVSGTGKAEITQHGLDLGLSVTLVPLNLSAMAFVAYEDHGAEGKEILLELGVDLPGPIPLASTGLGLFGFKGIFGMNGTLRVPDPAGDVVREELELQPKLLEWPPQRGAVLFDRRGFVLGLGAVVGTAPDLAFTFSCRAMLVFATPELAFRASLDGHLFSDRPKMADLAQQPDFPPGLTYLGLLVIDKAGLTIALRGEFNAKPLLDLTVPVSARFPASGDNWYIHLGSDNQGRPVRGPGPIEMSILPDLLNLNAWTYLMLHGNGLDQFGPRGVNLSGFVIAFGFGFHEVYGVDPIVLELDARVAAAIGTNPVMFVGTGELTGALHLGPISIGAHADIDLQVGPAGTRWAAFRVCGEVDLFFFSLSGCVHIEIGDENRQIPPPAEWPLKRVTLTDHRGRVLADAATSNSSVPTVWPDTIPVLSFSTGPAFALQDGVFTGALANSARSGWSDPWAGDGIVGSSNLQYTYALQDLQLVAVDSAGNETPVASGQDARWQLPGHSEPLYPGSPPGARDLALLTWESAPWSRFLADGGANGPHDPVLVPFKLCDLTRPAVAGWALGSQATQNGGWQLPPEPLRPVPYRSVVALTLVTTFAQQPFEPAYAAALRLPGGLLPTAIISYPAPLGTPEHLFAGALRLPSLPNLSADPGTWPEGLRQQAETRAIAALTSNVGQLQEAALWLRFDQRFENAVDVTTPGLPAGWNATDRFPAGDGTICVRFAPLGGAAVSELQISYPPNCSPSILGLHALTQTTIDNAVQGTAAAAGAASKQTAKANDPPADRRNLLRPGTLYKLTATLSGTGKGTDGRTSGPVTHTTSYWFATAAKPTASPRPPRYDHFTLAARYSNEDGFDPSYLERYLLGYTPLDHEQHWFRADQLAAHFAVGHIAGLADLYDHTVQLSLRRTDTAPGHPDTTPPAPVTLVELLASHLLSPADARTAAEAAGAPGPCRVPLSGASATISKTLDPDASYDLRVCLERKDGSGSVLLPGIGFHTSSYLSPKDLFAAAGLDQAGSNRVSGDLPVTTAALPPQGSDDAALAAALAALGLQHLPSKPATPSSSALWANSSGSGWQLAGLLIESTEPLERLDQGLGFDRLRLSAARGGTATLDQRWQNSSATRVLYLASAPIGAGSAFELDIQETTSPTQAATVTTLTVTAAAAPGFVSDLE